jgi:hypothetical protein
VFAGFLAPLLPGREALARHVVIRAALVAGIGEAAQGDFLTTIAAPDTGMAVGPLPRIDSLKDHIVVPAEALAEIVERRRIHIRRIDVAVFVAGEAEPVARRSIAPPETQAVLDTLFDVGLLDDFHLMLRWFAVRRAKYNADLYAVKFLFSIFAKRVEWV